MATYLTAGYLQRATELAAELPETPGASARLQHVVTGGPDGDVRYYTVFRDGRTVEQALGDDPDADVTLTAPYDDAVRIARGELDPKVAYMQGRVKVAGDMAKVVGLLAATSRPEHAVVAERLRDETVF